MARENGKRKSHAGRNTAVAAVILAALLGGHYGLGIGRGGEGLLTQSGESARPETEQTAVTETAPPAEPTPEAEPEATDDGRLEIVVREDQILYEGEAVDLTALEEALLRDYAEGVTVTLTDDHAIMATYDEVAALLASLNIPTE